MQVVVETLHEQLRATFVGHIDEHVLQRVREGAVAYVMQQYGQFHGLCLVGSNGNTLHLQHLQSSVHQIQRPKHVSKAGVRSTGIDHIGVAQLLDIAQPLEIGMLHNIVNGIVVNGEEAIHRVIDYLSFIGRHGRI